MACLTHDSRMRRTASFHLAVDEPWSAMVSVDLPLGFPESAPALSLQLVGVDSSGCVAAAAGPGVSRRLPGDMPWSPRWSADDAARRTLACLQEQARAMRGRGEDRDEV